MKKAFFVLLTLLIPVVLLLAAEGVLRVAGVGAEGRAVFVPFPGQPSHQALNPAYVTRYFRGFAPAVALHPFTVEKSEDTFRVFVLGGSSTAGFPYHFYHSFSEGLQSLLQDAAPERRIEVVNLGMSAVNSYTLWDLRHALVNAEPDAIVVYAGHNEYYGAFGVGSNVYGLGGQLWLKRLTLRLKHSALYTALADLLASPPEAAPRQTMMAHVVGDAAIAYNQDRYHLGVRQFAVNMHDVLTTFAHANIPVFLGLTASNLKDQPPLGDAPEAKAAYDEGQALFEAGRLAEAETAFVKAKEWDGLRFRAPEAINATLTQLAESGLGTLVDISAVARTNSTSGIADNGFFDDHLHPNAAGHAAIAAAFYAQMGQKWPWMHPAPLPTAEPDPIEAIFAALQIGVLEAGYPFNKTRTEAETEAVTRTLLQQTRQRSVYDSLAVVMSTQPVPPPVLLREGLTRAKQTQDTVKVLQLYQALLHWNPFNAGLLKEAAGYAVNSPAHAAWNEPIVAYGWARTRSLDYLNAWAALKLRKQHLTQADRLLTLAETQDPNAPVMLFNKARLLILQGDTTAAHTYFQRYRAQQ